MSACAALAFPLPRPGGDWLSAGAICRRAAISPRTLVRVAGNGSVLSRIVGDARARNGRQHREFLLSSLPADLRRKLLPLGQATEEKRLAAPSPEHAPLFAVAAPVPAGPRITLTPEGEREALAKLSVIQPLLDHADLSLRTKYSALRLQSGAAVENSNLLAAYICETRTLEGKKLSPSTLWRWLGTYRAEGLAGLARKGRNDAGVSRFFTRFPAAAQLAASEYLKPYATAYRAHEAICRDRELLRIPVAELPSYKTVLAF